MSGLNKVLQGVATLRGKYPVLPYSQPPLSMMSILTALEEFTECVRYLNTRRSKGAILQLSDEDSVQDALYLMLRPWITDLIWESPGEKVANRFSIKDFFSKRLKVVIEAKFIRDREHGKTISKELNDDIETYRYHPNCDDLIFFIYDPDGNIPDSSALLHHVAQARTYSDKVLNCYCVIKP